MADEQLSREFVEYRFTAIEDKIDEAKHSSNENWTRLSDALDRLTGAIITREVFDELSRDVSDLADRTSELQFKVRLYQYIFAGVWIVVGPLAIGKLQELFG